MILQALTAALAAGNGHSIDDAVVAYDAAQVSGDRAALTELLADDYLLVNSRGGVQTKAEFIAELTDPSFNLEPFAVERPTERTWAGGAVRGGVARLKGSASGTPYEVCLRFVDVWRLEGGRWRVAYTQAAKVADDQCSASAPEAH